MSPLSRHQDLPTVTLIIPSYRRGPILSRTLAHLRICEPQAEEWLIVDQSGQIDSAVEKEIRAAGSKARIIRLERPNAQAARNRAAREARGEILLFLDDDVVPDRDLIEAHRSNYRDPNIHAVGGFYTEPGENATAKTGEEVGWLPLTRLERIPANYVERVDSPLWPSCNGSIRREVYLKIGGMDENFRYTLYDDTDLSLRLEKRGYRCVHDPRARLVHLKEPTGGVRPRRTGDRVIASREKWYTWFYFFWVNYRWRGWGEIFVRMRTNVFRKPYFLRPDLLSWPFGK